MKLFIHKLFKLFTGFALSFTLGIVVFTLGEFVGIAFKLNETSLVYLFLTLGTAFITLTAGTYIWMKFASLKSFLIFIVTIGSFYFAGKMFASKMILPFQEAKKLESESAVIFNSWLNAPLTVDNFEKYLSDNREGVAKLDKARSLNFGYELWIKKHYQDLYELRKEMYDTDEKIGRGELKFTESETELMLNDYNNRISELSILPSYPFWMTLYGVQP